MAFNENHRNSTGGFFIQFCFTFASCDLSLIIGLSCLMSLMGLMS